MVHFIFYYIFYTSYICGVKYIKYIYIILSFFLISNAALAVVTFTSRHQVKFVQIIDFGTFT